MSQDAIAIRRVSVDDAREIAEIYRPVVEDSTISFELVAPDAQEMRRRIERVLALYPWLVAVSRDAVVGYAYASRHRERAAYVRSVDTSIYISSAARGRGIGTLLYGALFQALEQSGSFHRAFAGIALPNDASVALHRKLGFTRVGTYHQVGFKFGRWIDVAWWERPV
jgi:L-amino acid N-acyltransferase YncA